MVTVRVAFLETCSAPSIAKPSAWNRLQWSGSLHGQIRSPPNLKYRNEIKWIYFLVRCQTKRIKSIHCFSTLHRYPTYDIVYNSKYVRYANKIELICFLRNKYIGGKSLSNWATNFLSPNISYIMIFVTQLLILGLVWKIYYFSNRWF